MRIGDTLGGRYRIVAPLGKGGMGSVYLAEDLRLDRKWRAVKVTRPLPEERESFIREARLLCSLEHPLLPQIVDYFPPEDGGTACIVMEYIAGDTLADRFVRHGRRMPFVRVLRYLTQLAEVLAYLHAQRPPVVFRDLKPANVIIDAADRAVLVDFGIARRYRPDAAADTARLGTPGFAAPEQLRGEQSDGRTDLYALGALAYFLLSGGEWASRRGAGWRHRLGDDVPGAFIQLLERLLADDPAHRPASAEDVREALMTVANITAVTNSDSEAAEDVASPAPERWRPGAKAWNGAAETAFGRGGGSRGGRGLGRMPEGTRLVALVPAYPGAGATFAAFSLSAALSRRGAAHAVVECPGAAPEHYELLHGARRMPGHAPFAVPGGTAPTGPAWRRGAAAHFPLAPDTLARAAPEAPFGRWLRRLGEPLVLLDGSGAYDAPERAVFLAEWADELLVVADCVPSKWNDRRRETLQAAVDAALARGAAVRWVVNRDQPFTRRRDWLALFPAPPVAHLPQLPPGAIVEAAWDGTAVPASGAHAAALDRAWERLLALWGISPARPADPAVPAGPASKDAARAARWYNRSRWASKKP